MSGSTTNLGLFKYDPTTDGESTFNIKSALNDNWDKVDLDSEAKATALATNATAIASNAAALASYSAEIVTVATPNKILKLDANGKLPTDITGHADSDISKAGGTMVGILIAQSNTSYTVAQLHNVILSTSDAVLASMSNGDIWIKYV